MTDETTPTTETTTEPVNSWLNDYEKARAAKLAAHEAGREAKKLNLFAMLAAAGLDKFEIDYSGYGDSFNGFDYDVSKLSKAAQEAVEDFANEVLEDYHAGFENNEGGNGTFTFDVENNKVSLVHNTVIESYETESAEF